MKGNMHQASTSKEMQLLLILFHNPLQKSNWSSDYVHSSAGSVNQLTDRNYTDRLEIS